MWAVGPRFFFQKLPDLPKISCCVQLTWRFAASSFLTMLASPSALRLVERFSLYRKDRFESSSSYKSCVDKRV